MNSEKNHTLAVRLNASKVTDDLVSEPALRVSDRIGYDMPATEESLVVDARFALSPAQVVETKLTRVLREATMPVSHLQMRGLLRSR